MDNDVEVCEYPEVHTVHISILCISNLFRSLRHSAGPLAVGVVGVEAAVWADEEGEEDDFGWVEVARWLAGGWLVAAGCVAG